MFAHLIQCGLIAGWCDVDDFDFLEVAIDCSGGGFVVFECASRYGWCSVDFVPFFKVFRKGNVLILDNAIGQLDFSLGGGLDSFRLSPKP